MKIKEFLSILESYGTNNNYKIYLKKEKKRLLILFSTVSKNHLC